MGVHLIHSNSTTVEIYWIYSSMKFIAATTFALVAADKAAIDKQLLALIQNSSLRAFTGQIANQIPNLDEYGCWCYFYDNVGRGKGNPVDEVDAMCKTLGEGYECAMRDSEDEGSDCTPWEVAYTPAQDPDETSTRAARARTPI